MSNYSEEGIAIDLYYINSVYLDYLCVQLISHLFQGFDRCLLGSLGGRCEYLIEMGDLLSCQQVFSEGLSLPDTPFSWIRNIQSIPGERIRCSFNNNLFFHQLQIRWIRDLPVSGLAEDLPPIKSLITVFISHSPCRIKKIRNILYLEYPDNEMTTYYIFEKSNREEMMYLLNRL